MILDIGLLCLIEHSGRSVLLLQFVLELDY
jgi:hypothetical protein